MSITEYATATGRPARRAHHRVECGAMTMARSDHHPWSTARWTGALSECAELRRFAREFDWSNVVGAIDPEDSAVQIVDAIALEIERAGDEMAEQAATCLRDVLEESAREENRKRGL
jgi:hypothetical protein